MWCGMLMLCICDIGGDRKFEISCVVVLIERMLVDRLSCGLNRKRYWEDLCMVNWHLDGE